MRMVWGMALAAAACATAPLSEDKAVRQIEHVTEAVYLGNDRIKLTTDKPLLMPIEDLEFAVLARAADAASERGAERFAIVHAEYHQRGAFLSPDLEPLGQTYIGSYERLLRFREEEQKRFGQTTGMTVVVQLQEEGEISVRQSFDAEETYEAMIGAWIKRGDL
ncbi:hypothetical protein [Parvularcula maris]|uniref:Uncharacterized protein n=1 Tax=Parvularcula maris TaxID=2965077 RepID=A0A9X2LCI8_9PROT|nr:hypothetical protein [Parvularcula maris]MCQ8185977.1 hypothetical protein [Parvularcula maris]